MTKGSKRARAMENVDLEWDEPGVSLQGLLERSISANPGTGGPGSQSDLLLELIDHNPYQARQVFDMASMQELADSVREHGVIEPIIVRPSRERYEIVAGERRYRAALMAELSHIPTRIMDLDDTQAAIFTALENLQREDLDIEDEGRQFAYLQQLTGLSQRKLGQKLGKERQYISRRIRLLKRPDLLHEYRSGMRTLHQVLSLVGGDQDEATEIEELPQSGSAGPTPGLAETGSRGPTSELIANPEEVELIERDDLGGYLVERYSSGNQPGRTDSTTAAALRGGTRFRWRPLQQFYTWVGRMKPEEVPADERATVKAQVAEIKIRLEQLEKALEEAEIKSGS